MNKGQSLFEVVMALSIIALITFGMVVLATNSIRNSTFSRDKTLATTYSQEALEWLRGQRDNNWTLFYGYATAGAGTTYCLNSEPMPANNWGTTGVCSSANFIGTTGFKREITLKSIDSGTIEADVKVYWNDSQGYHEVATVTNFTNFRAK